jgi:hypothetical protein
MTKPQDLAAFTDKLLASEEIRSLASGEWGESANEKWATFERGEQLDDLHDLVLGAKDGALYDYVGSFEGAGPDDDTFDIEIKRIGPVFFVTANEFDDLQFFGSEAEAEEYAQDFFAPYVEALAEREADDEDEDDD